MTLYFFIKAYDRADEIGKRKMEKHFPFLFTKKEEVSIDSLKVGKWYECVDLISGCQGFNGKGICVKQPKHNHSGLFITEFGAWLKGNDGAVWRVNGKFYKLSVIESLRLRFNLS